MERGVKGREESAEIERVKRSVDSQRNNKTAKLRKMDKISAKRKGGRKEIRGETRSGLKKSNKSPSTQKREK